MCTSPLWFEIFPNDNRKYVRNSHTRLFYNKSFEVFIGYYKSKGRTIHLVQSLDLIDCVTYNSLLSLDYIHVMTMKMNGTSLISSLIAVK